MTLFMQSCKGFRCTRCCRVSTDPASALRHVSTTRLPAGGTVGSSFTLLDELIEIAPYLGIHLSEDGSLPATEAARLFRISETSETPEGDFGQEMTAWLSLHEAAELSITYGTSIVLTPSSS